MAKKSVKARSSSPKSSKLTAAAGAKLPTVPAWKKKWPATDDLATWFRCGIDKCKAIKEIEIGTNAAHLPIWALAELGHITESLEHVEYFWKKLKSRSLVEAVRLAELGAQISLLTNDMIGCESFLQRVLDQEELITRKCDRGYPAKAVHDFRVLHGLLDPEDVLDAKDKVDATFNRSMREYQLALQAGDKEKANSIVPMMIECTDKVEGWLKSLWLRRVIGMLEKQGEIQLIGEIIDRVPKRDHQDLIGFELFKKLGMRDQAKAAAVKSITEAQHKLLSMTDPNIHFPIHRIVCGLHCLIDIGEKEQAALLFEQVAKNANKWKCVIQGWTTTAVLVEFVPIVEILEGKEAAEELANLASQHAESEKHKGFKRGAVAAALKSGASLSSLEETITKASKIRSPTQRRLELAKIYARAKRWKELKSTCMGVESPEEAAKIAWWIKFELPGGDVE